MNKNIEEFKRNKDILTNWEAINLVFKILEDFEKRLKKIEDKQNRKISGPIITKIISQEEEEKNIKVGGANPD